MERVSFKIKVENKYLAFCTIIDFCTYKLEIVFKHVEQYSSELYCMFG